MKTLFLYILLIACTLIGCTLSKKIDIELPPYEQKTMVECYLEPGKPYLIYLTKSISYFDSEYPTVSDAIVSISHNGVTDTLKYAPFKDTTIGKSYTYLSNNIIDKDYNSPYFLYIKEKNGNVITGQANLLAPVPIDTITYTFSNKAKGNVSLHVKFKDDPSEKNYYRLLVTHNGLRSEPKNSDDIYNDDNLKTTEFEASVYDRFDKGDTLIVTLAHMTKELYDFNYSVKAAERANGNPFVQPAAIRSNVTGGAIGIFAGYTYSRDTVIIK